MTILKILLLSLLIILPGCIHPVTNESAPNSFYLNPDKNLNQIGRVALVDLTNNSVVHQISPNVTESLYQELQKQQIFGLTRIRRDNAAWRSLQVDTEMNYTFEQLAQMRKILNCDAVLTGVITGYEPYPHMTIGLRLQMIDLSDGRLIWALEQVWDTTDKTTRHRIEEYYTPKQVILNDENLSGRLGLVSALKFFKFVAHEITQTLKPAP